MTMTNFRNAVAEGIADRGPPLTKKQVRSVILAVWDAITATVLTEGKLSVHNFGTFRLVRRPARWNRNPKTGAKLRKKADATIKLRCRVPLK